MRIAMVLSLFLVVSLIAGFSVAQQKNSAAPSWTTRIASTDEPVVVPTTAKQLQAIQPISATAVLAPPTALPIAAPSTSATELVRQHLQQIDTQLSEMLAHPPHLWDPMAVAPQLQSLAVTAPTAELREQSQLLLAKAVRSAQVQQGYAEVAGNFQASVRPAAPQVSPSFPVQQAEAQVPVATRNAAYYTAPPSPYAQGPLHVAPEFRGLAPTNLLARVRQVAYNVGGTGRVESNAAPTPATGQPQVIASAVDENGYSGTGWLMPLVARSQMSLESRSGVPPLALTDDEGNVKFLVTPTTGVSLREYLRKEVGIVGPVGTLPDIATPHITAQRAVVLERHE